MLSRHTPGGIRSSRVISSPNLVVSYLVLFARGGGFLVVKDSVYLEFVKSLVEGQGSAYINEGRVSGISSNKIHLLPTLLFSSTSAEQGGLDI